MAGSQSPKWPDSPSADQPVRSSIFSNLASVITGATQTASDEFDRLRESIGFWTREEPPANRSLQGVLVQDRYPELLHNRVIPDPPKVREKRESSHNKARRPATRRKDVYSGEDSDTYMRDEAESGSDELYSTPPEIVDEQLSFSVETNHETEPYKGNRGVWIDEIMDGRQGRRSMTPDLTYRYQESLQLEAERVAKLEREVQAIKAQMADLVASSPSAASSPSSLRSIRTVHFSPLPMRVIPPSLPPHSPIPRPPPMLPTLRPRSTEKAKVTKPTPRSSVHGLAGAQKVLPTSTFVRAAFQQQPNRVPDDKHVHTMREIIGQIPQVKLRRTDVIR
ncbi:hypothetical protein DFQ28_009307 [Apophysomyces sp. BC1034]|nr:hypothetical protein DFQ29_008039 [Apophysomyces sp. BC1021]KAG0185437.1 hypothetical protein DFQ28_009307 [Apophysomyces sp. BC1034]